MIILKQERTEILASNTITDFGVASRISQSGQWLRPSASTWREKGASGQLFHRATGRTDELTFVSTFGNIR